MTALVRVWTLRRASSVGITAGIIAFALAVLVDSWPETLLYPYAALLAVTIFCGASILWITARDMRIRGTSNLMRPIRGFDLFIGFALLLPASYALSEIWRQLGL